MTRRDFRIRWQIRHLDAVPLRERCASPHQAGTDEAGHSESTHVKRAETLRTTSPCTPRNQPARIVKMPDNPGVLLYVVYAVVAQAVSTIRDRMARPPFCPHG